MRKARKTSLPQQTKGGISPLLRLPRLPNPANSCCWITFVGRNRIGMRPRERWSMLGWRPSPPPGTEKRIDGSSQRTGVRTAFRMSQTLLVGSKAGAVTCHVFV